MLSTSLDVMVQSCPTDEPKNAPRQSLFAECPVRVNKGKLTEEEHAGAVRHAQIAARRAAENRYMRCRRNINVVHAKKLITDQDRAEWDVFFDHQESEDWAEEGETDIMYLCADTDTENFENVSRGNADTDTENFVGLADIDTVKFYQMGRG